MIESKRKQDKTVVRKQASFIFKTVARAKTQGKINEEKSRIAPEVGRYEPKYFASKPNNAWVMDYSKFHAAGDIGSVQRGKTRQARSLAITF